MISGFLITRILTWQNPAVFYFHLVSKFLCAQSWPHTAFIGTPCRGRFNGVMRPHRSSAALSFSFDPGVCLTGVLASIATFSFNWYDIWNGTKTAGMGIAWGVLWSLSIEEQFYLFYPMLLRRMAAWQKIRICLLSVVILAFSTAATIYFSSV